jgi:hypothetical protein
VLAERSPLRILAVGSPAESAPWASIVALLGREGTTVDVLRISVNDLMGTPPEGSDSHAELFDVACMVDSAEQSIDPVHLLTALSRMCHPDGLVVLMAASAETPDAQVPAALRIQPAGLAALAECTGLALVEAWRDDAGPSHDVVGVYRWRPRSAAPITPDPKRLLALDDPAQNFGVDVPDPEIEREEGRVSAGEFLAAAHVALSPRFYLEIGVWQGTSLRLARCDSVGIDPLPEISEPLPSHLRIVEVSSEAFFRDPAFTALLGPLDLAYIDGLHLSEIALRDFMLVERHAHGDSIVLVDDIFPVNTLQGQRARVTSHWTGDVWKLVDVLARLRPDLLMIPLETRPTGTLMIAGLDPQNATLWEAHDTVMADLMVDCEPPDAVLERTGAFQPDDPIVVRIIERLRDRREGHPVRWSNTRLRELVNGGLPRTVVDIR